MMYRSVVLLLTLLSCVYSTLVNLNENNWNQMLDGEWMVEFFAPWCPACKGLQPVWEEFATWSDDLDINIAQVDVTASPGLSGRFMVTALPTIYHVKDGEFRQYRGSRDKDEFINYVEDKKWTGTEPIPSWKSPSSFQMSAVSYFFKLSMVLRAIHTSLIEEYGLPYWGSYIVFALATVIIGALLGLILVCVVDFVFPPRTAASAHDNAEKLKANENDQDIMDDEHDDNSEDMDEDLSQDDDEGSQTEGESQDAMDGSSQSSEHSQTEEEEEEEQSTESPSVRKRKPRKAD